jgi:hypothetical protein
MRAKLNSFALPRAGFLLVGLFAGLFPDISAANPTPTHPSYTFTDLGPPGEAFSSARAINDAGHVAGFSSSPGGGYYAHATVWNGTTQPTCAPSGFQRSQCHQQRWRNYEEALPSPRKPARCVPRHTMEWHRGNQPGTARCRAPKRGECD